MSKRIVLVGGGSGGHVFPLIAVAQSLRAQDPSLELLVFAEGPFLAQAARDNGLGYKSIMAGKVRRYFSFLNVIDFIKLPFGLVQSLWHLFWYMPDAIFCKGGYVSVLPAIAARIYMIPVYTHESDAVPGLANRIIGKFAKKVFTSFESAAVYFKPDQTTLVGNPVRSSVVSATKESGQEYFQLNSSLKTILVTGGSQGAKTINQMVLPMLPIIAGEYQMIHQCGESQIVSVQSAVDVMIKEGEKSYGPKVKERYHLYSFFNADELAKAYGAADVIISRAGASNLFEIAALGKPAIIIPITNSSGDHQMQNAKEFAKFGAIMIEESNLTPHIVITQIKNLLEPSKYAEASAKIKTFAKPEAANQIASILLNS